MDNKSFFAACCSQEYPRFLKVLEAVPDGGLDWRPEPKARTTRELVGHLLGHEQDLVELADDGTIHHRMVVPFTNMAEAIELYKEAHAQLEARLAGLSDDAWGRTAQMFVGEHMAWEGATYEMMWGFLFDAIHHRGQLSTYLRPMGSKVPAIYGPSADDPGGA